MNKRDKVLVVTVVILMIVALIIGFAYAYLTYNYKQNSDNIYETACYHINYDEDIEGVEIRYAVPVTDADGLKQTPYTVTMTNNCDETYNYKLYLNVLNTSTLPISYIKVGVNSTVNYLNNYTTTTSSVANSTTAYRLEQGTITAGTSKTFAIRAWIAPEVTEGTNSSFANKITIDVVKNNS